ncbi:MAG TPA: hypothetical protein VFF27_05910 [Bacteroidia bacterium]|jgi:hypothetical protein|nr:hypothetical protein [Bacteroidia bacterium]
MKTVSLFCTAFILVVQNLNAQTEPILKSVHKGSVTITPYFGFPNLLTAAIQNTYELTNQKKEQLSIRGVGPIGIRAEYFIIDHLAIGGEISYANTRIDWKEKGSLKLPDSTSVPYTYSFSLKAPRVRTLVKLNYHFLTRTHSDWYAGVGIGYNNTRIKLTTDAPYIRDYDILSLYFLPISARINFGFSYYFTKNIGLNAEVGLGGPLGSIGISGKF